MPRQTDHPAVQTSSECETKSGETRREPPIPIKLTAFEWGGRAVQGRVVDGLVSGAAGTTTHWPGAVLSLVLLAFCLLIVIYLLTHPALLWRRLRSGPLAEPEPRQKIVVSLLLCVAALSVISLLDLNHGWSHIPAYIAPIGDLLVAGGLVLIWLVFRVNPFAAAAVKVETEQTVISTGPYALVRHPMYSGGLLLFLGSPLALGSCWGLVPFPPILVLIIWRLKNEETYLSTHLPGYRDYCAKVTHRLIPSIW
jgi:protein-S-isoprenylcysteine O-methyltransferase Ste14